MVLQGKITKTKTSKFSYLSEPFEALELGRKEMSYERRLESYDNEPN